MSSFSLRGELGRKLFWFTKNVRSVPLWLTKFII